MNRYLEKVAQMCKVAESDFQPIKPQNRGKLHEALGIPEGEEIPVSRLREIAASTNDPHMKKMVQFALNARGWNHSKKAESHDDISWVVPATTAIVPTVALGASHYTNLHTRDQFKPEEKALNKALRSNIVKTTAALALLGGGAAAAAEYSRRAYLDAQKKEQTKDIKKAIESTVESLPVAQIKGPLRRPT